MKLKTSEELVKYLTERAVGFISTPKVERKMMRSRHKETWSYRWFGLLPIAFQIWKKRRK